MTPPRTTATVRVSPELAEAIAHEAGGGDLNWFVLLGLSPRQASPQDVKFAVADLMRRLREVLYDNDLGREARELKKTVQEIEGRLATARDIADYRRDLEAAPQRNQFALLRQFEEEARKAFVEAPKPARTLVDTLGGRARQLGLSDSLAGTLLEKLWDEFAPVPTDPGEVAQRPSVVEEVRVQLPEAQPPSAAPASMGLFAPRGGAERAGPGTTDARRTAPEPSAIPGFEAFLPLPGQGPAQPAEPGRVEAIGGAPQSFTFSDFLGSPIPPSPAAEPGARAASPFALDLPAAIPAPALKAPTESLGKRGARLDAGAAAASEAPAAAGGAGAIGAAWKAAAQMPEAFGVADRRLARVEVTAWRGYFPAYAKSARESRGQLERAALAVGGAAAAALARAPRAGEEPSPAPAADDAEPAEAEPSSRGRRAAAGAPAGGDAPRPVSFRAQRPPAAAEELDPALADFAGPYSAGSPAQQPGAWQVMTATPGEGEHAGGTESLFIDRVYELAGKKGLSRAAERQLLDEANSYGLTQGRALSLIEERFPRSHQLPMSHKALAGLQARRDALADVDGRPIAPVAEEGGAALPGGRGAPGDAPTEPEFLVVEVEEPYARKLARSFVHQVPGLVVQLLSSWQVILAGMLVFAFLGLSWIWRQASGEGSGSSAAAGAVIVSGAAPPDTIAGPSPAAAAEVDYLSSPLRTRATLRPDQMVRVGARFLEGGSLVPQFEVRASEVTIQEWEDFCVATGHARPAAWSGGEPPAGSRAFPVTGVTPEEALAYCRWRSDRDRLANARYSLPSDRQYQVLLRYAGATTPGEGVVAAPMPYPASVGGRDTIAIEGREVFHVFGNVAEWAIVEATREAAAVGCGWSGPPPPGEPLAPRPVPPSGRDAATGFRYVRNAAP